MRRWVDDAKKNPKDKRWVMQCDVGLSDPSRMRCDTTTPPSDGQPDLDALAAAGWFIAKLAGDACPSCLAAGFVPTVEEMRPRTEPII